MEHPQVHISNGIYVDEKLVYIIAQLWSLDCKTFHSCQGDEHHDGYISANPFGFNQVMCNIYKFSPKNAQWIIKNCFIRYKANDACSNHPSPIRMIFEFKHQDIEHLNEIFKELMGR